MPRLWIDDRCRGGLLGLTGYDDGAPVGSGTNYPDHVPNPLHGAVAVLAALRKRRRTGQGEYIELAQLESTVNAIGPAIVAAAAGKTVRPAGNRDDVAAPHGVYPCAGVDSWCALAVFDDEQWAATRELLGRDWPHRPELDSAEGRRHRRPLLDELLATATRSWEARQLSAELTRRGVAASPVLHADDLVYSDPQLRARGHWITLDHEVMGPSIYDGIPYRMSRTPGHLRAPAPRLGAHTRAVCVELLGVAEESYDALVSEGAVG